MRNLLTILASLFLVLTAIAQPEMGTVQAYTNGVIARPRGALFWEANSNAINAVVTGGGGGSTVTNVLLGNYIPSTNGTSYGFLTLEGPQTNKSTIYFYPDGGGNIGAASGNRPDALYVRSLIGGSGFLINSNEWFKATNIQTIILGNSNNTTIINLSVSNNVVVNLVLSNASSTGQWMIKSPPDGSLWITNSAGGIYRGTTNGIPVGPNDIVRYGDIPGLVGATGALTNRQDNVEIGGVGHTNGAITALSGVTANSLALTTIGGSDTPGLNLLVREPATGVLHTPSWDDGVVISNVNFQGTFSGVISGDGAGLSNISLITPASLTTNAIDAFFYNFIANGRSKNWSFNNVTLIGGTNTGVDTGTNEVLYVTMPGSAAMLAGMAGGASERHLVLFKNSVQPLTILNDTSADGTAANRIYTCSGGDITFSNAQTALFFTYSGTYSRWVLIGGGSGGSAVTTSSGNTNVNWGAIGGTLSLQTDLQNALDALSVATASTNTALKSWATNALVQTNTAVTAYLLSTIQNTNNAGLAYMLSTVGNTNTALKSWATNALALSNTAANAYMLTTVQGSNSALSSYLISTMQSSNTALSAYLVLTIQNTNTGLKSFVTNAIELTNTATTAYLISLLQNTNTALKSWITNALAGTNSALLAQIQSSITNVPGLNSSGDINTYNLTVTNTARFNELDIAVLVATNFTTVKRALSYVNSTNVVLDFQYAGGYLTLTTNTYFIAPINLPSNQTTHFSYQLSLAQDSVGTRKIFWLTNMFKAQSGAVFNNSTNPLAQDKFYLEPDFYGTNAVVLPGLDVKTINIQQWQ